MLQRNSAVGSRAGRWPTIRSTGGTNAAAWDAPTPGPSCGWSATTATRCGPDQIGSAGGKAGAARTVRGLDAHHRHGAPGRRRVPVDRRSSRPGDHSRRVQSHARRRTRRVGKSPRRSGAAVVGRRDDRLGETPVAMVELRESNPRTPPHSSSYLRNRLARYEIPTEIAIVDELPRTPSGKPDLGAIRRHFSEHIRGADTMPSESATVGNVLRRQARSRGDHPLLICDAERISYAEAERLSAVLARGLSISAPAREPMSDFSTPTVSLLSSGCWPRRGSAPSSYPFRRSPPRANSGSNSSTVTPKSCSRLRPSDPTTTRNA